MSQAEESDKRAAEEHEWTVAAQQGDRQAFARLVERYWDALYRWLYHGTHNRHTAEDLAQETFLKAFAGLHGFRAGSNFRAWLFRIAHNNLINHRRAANRLQRPLADHAPAAAPDPVESTLSRESLQLLAQAVNRLPVEFRTAFLLRAEQGLSFREIADVLNTTEETARWRVFKARHKLMSVLAPQLDREKS